MIIGLGKDNSTENISTTSPEEFNQWQGSYDAAFGTFVWGLQLVP